MDIDQAHLAGLRAFEAGRARAPALNRAFTTAIFNQNDTPANDLLEAYLYGWDVANLASSAIPGAPSLERYREILAASEAPQTLP